MGKKNLLSLGIITYTVMAGLSLYFYKERTMFTDIAYHLFVILKDSNFAIQNYRFGAFFTQLFPLTGSKMGLSLSMITQLYSLSFIILYASTFFVLLKIDKSKNIALCYLLFSVLMVRHTFFWVQSELPQAAAFAFIYFALLYNILQSTSIFFWKPLLLLLLLVLVVFTHPLMLFLVSFILIFIAHKFPQKKLFILIQFISFVFVYLVKSYFFKTSYDLHAMSKLLQGLKLFPHYLDIPSNTLWLKYFTSDYLLLSLLFISSIIYLILQKRFFLVSLMSLYFLGYSFIVNLTEIKGSEQYYIENQYLLLAAFVVIPFVFDVYPKITQRVNGNFLIAPVILLSLVFLFKSHKNFSARLEFLQQFVSNIYNSPPVRKVVLPRETLPQQVVFMDWGIAYEVWLISTVEHKETLSVIEEEHENEFEDAFKSAHSFQAKWGLFDYKDFPQRYFVFKDTINTYVRY